MQKETRNELAKVELLSKAITPGGSDLFTPIKVIYALFLTVLGWVTLSIEVFMRTSFGERYLTLLRLILAWAMLGVYRLVFTFFIYLTRIDIGASTFFRGVPEFSLTMNSPLFRWYTRLFLLLGLIHLGYILWRNRRNVPWHSQSFGVSWLRVLPVSDWTLYRFVEPALFMFLGVFLAGERGFYDPLLGWWLLFAGASMFIKNLMLYGDYRGRMLDVTDARIESEVYSLSIQGAPKQQTKGFSVIPIPRDGVFTEAVGDIATTVKETLDD